MVLQAADSLAGLPSGRRLFCSLCGRLRSSRRHRMGPSDIVDRFICSRTHCALFKRLLAPSVQINYYHCVHPEAAARTWACPPRVPVPDDPPVQGTHPAETPRESSVTGRAELPGHSVALPSATWRGNDSTGCLPPLFDRSTKPSAWRR
ncbi:hypothetical protein SEUCBS140593_010403 [Sporothrix eucalyptigena]|uniref:Uncharacterized protein n=1 Tax=Sporothrix eucalyptigena TaxID=1812306 RepID=A0ABP0D191_9PEZI